MDLLGESSVHAANSSLLILHTQVILIFAFVCWLGVVIFLPETFAPVLLAKKAKKLRKEGNEKAWAPHERTDWSVGGVAKRTLLRPFQILALEPMLLLITIYLSVVSLHA